MLDEKSLVVTYKHWRGEKRGSLKKAEATPGAFGDCIDCNQCVAVCPTGIDIREGPQIGCITCALCIDACDKVMAQVGRPRGLIDYCTQDDAEGEQIGRAPSELQSLMRISYAVFCLKKKKQHNNTFTQSHYIQTQQKSADQQTTTRQ